MNRKYIALILALTLFGCKTNESDETALAEIPNVKTAVATEKVYTSKIMYTGTVYAKREANLGAALPGKVERIHFTEGSKVKKGDLIVELSDEMLTQAEIENQALKKDFERIKRLRQKESVSQIDYDHLKAKLDASNAKTEMVRKNTRVYAPFAGTIVEQMMEEGEIYFINPGLDPGYSMRSGIVRLMQLNPVKIVFDVNEKDLYQVKPGLDVTISVDAYPDKTYSAKINSIKPMLTTLTRCASAEVTLSNTNEELKPGMFARISVMLPNQKSVFIPMNAITKLPGTNELFVYVVENNMAKRIVVKQTETVNDEIAVTGIKPNQLVITEGKAKVRNGEKVNIK